MNGLTINTERLKQNYDFFKKIGPVYFPLRANCNLKILTELNKLFDNNDKFAISSFEHALMLQGIGVDMNRISVINTLFPAEELEKFYKLGIRDFVIDNFTVLNKFQHKDNVIWLRVNTSCFVEEYESPFGLDIKTILDTNIKRISIYCTDVSVNELQRKFLKLKNAFSIRIGGFGSTANLEELFESGFIIEPGMLMMDGVVDYYFDVLRIKNRSIIIDSSVFTTFTMGAVNNRQFRFYVNGKDVNHSERGLIPHIIYGNSTFDYDKVGVVFLDKDDINFLEVYGIIMVENVGAYFDSLKNKDCFMDISEGYDMRKFSRKKEVPREAPKEQPKEQPKQRGTAPPPQEQSRIIKEDRPMRYGEGRFGQGMPLPQPPQEEKKFYTRDGKEMTIIKGRDPISGAGYRRG